MKGTRIVVFVGPSVDKETAKEILDAEYDVEYMPPAKRGDVSRAANDGAEIICLIDGVFFQDSAVAHREILYALKKGVKVIGSSSMGALRASELDLYGMEGVGKIYEWYKSGKLVSDDEVALFFDPVYFKPLSEPLVNIRYNLRIAEAKGVIDRDACEKVLKIAKSLYFPDRTYQRILDAAEGVLKGIVNFKMRKELHLGKDATFHFGIRESREMEEWNPGITFLDDWSYFDSKEEKLGWLRLMGRVGLFRKMQWTVHYRLNQPWAQPSRPAPM